MPKLLRFVAWFQIIGGVLTTAYGAFVVYQGGASHIATFFGGAIVATVLVATVSVVLVTVWLVV